MKRLLGAVGMVLGLAAAAGAADVPDLVKQLKDADPTVRRAAAKALGEACADAKTAVGPLAKALKDTDPFVRRFAAQALGEIGPDAKDAVPALNDLIKRGTDRKEVLEAAATALGKIGAGKVGVAALAATVKDKSADVLVRRKAAESLGAMGPDAKAAIPALLSVLKPAGNNAMPRGGDFRPEVAEALGQIAGPDDKAAVDTLTALSTDRQVRDRNLKKAINDALKKIQAKKS
jgi:HEAT repeat protein